jgi:D-alanyl-D-alanine carboxypeptidase (penicillin-binding protein 5/6)
MRHLAVLLAFVASPVVAQTFQTTAPFAYMKDVTSGQVLYSKAADERMPPASMAKMMSTYLAFDMITRGQVKLDQMITVRPETWQKWHGPEAGSTMFLSPGEQVSVENLLHGIVTLSGNDACVVLAEGLAGTEAEYVAAMNRLAKKIGLKGSRFANTTGWPHPDEYVTPRDLAIIAERTITDFPELYKRFYGQPSFTWGKTLNGGVPITQPNRDPLLGRVQGADGLKTGHTEEAGYGFTGSAQQGGRRLVMVVAGLTSFNERIAASVSFMDWGFRAFRAVPVAKAGRQLQTAEVQGGDETSVGLVAPRDLIVSAPASAGQVAAKVRYIGPVKAPIARGQKVAELIVTAPGMATARFPLVAASAVGEAGPFDRLAANFKRLFGM